MSTKTEIEGPMRHLAEIFEVPLKTLAGWKKIGVNIRSPRAVAAHIATLRRKPKAWAEIGETEVSRQDLLKEDVRKRTAEANKLELSMEILRGELLPRGTVERQQAEIGYVVNALLRGAISELPPLVAGLSAVKAEKVIRDWSIRWAEELKTADSEVWRAARAAVIAELRGDARRAALAIQREANRGEA